LAKDETVIQRVAFAIEVALEILDQGFFRPEHRVFVDMWRAAAKLGIPASTLESKIRSLKINKYRFKER
jgi:hypothetical protein